MRTFEAHQRHYSKVIGNRGFFRRVRQGDVEREDEQQNGDTVSSTGSFHGDTPTDSSDNADKGGSSSSSSPEKIVVVVVCRRKQDLDVIFLFTLAINH